MALKAGTVGVNPKGVDKNGMPKAGDTYTKLEINQMMASKVPVSQLRANNKDFTFAYDSTSEKYGYKAGADGEFVPFDGAGGDGLILTNLDATGISLSDSDITILSGGFEIIDGVIYCDITLKNETNSNKYTNITGIPNRARAGIALLYYDTIDNAANVAAFKSACVQFNIATTSISSVPVDKSKVSRLIFIIEKAT